MKVKRKNREEFEVMIEKIKQRVKGRKKTIVLPETMDKRIMAQRQSPGALRAENFFHGSPEIPHKNGIKVLPTGIKWEKNMAPFPKRLRMSSDLESLEESLFFHFGFFKIFSPKNLPIK